MNVETSGTDDCGKEKTNDPPQACEKTCAGGSLTSSQGGQGGTRKDYVTAPPTHPCGQGKMIRIKLKLKMYASC